jgi:hypothetical protein
MRAKNLLILVVLAAIVVLIAFVGSKKKEAAPPEVVGMAVLPKLDVNGVEKIAIKSSVGSLTLARINDVWCIREKFGYPASFTKIRSALRKLADMKIGQVVDVSEAGKTDLKMRMPSSGTNSPASGSGISVELLGKGDAKVASLLVGDSHRRKQEGAPADYRGYPDGQYVSTDGGKNVYLVKESLEEISADGKSWLDSEIMNIPGADISGITVALTNGESLKLSRPKGGGGLVVDGLKDNEETDGSKLYGVEGALSYLRFDDVADSSLSAAQLGMDKPAIFTAVTTNGEIYTVKIGGTAPNGDSRYMTIGATAVETNEAVVTSQSDTNKNEKAVEQAAVDKAAHRKEIEKKVTALQEKVGKWTYVVASHKANAMLSTRGALVKKKEVPTAVETGKQAKPSGVEPKKTTPKPDASKEQGGTEKKTKGGGAFGWLKKLF